MFRKLYDLRHEIIRFSSVGLIAYLISVGGFNFMVHSNSAVLSNKPITASILAGVISILFAYFGNRHWTWRDREWSGFNREIFLFFAINLFTLFISVVFLAISRYVMGLDSVLADNISFNVIGATVGTIIRFWSYRTHVFKP